MSKTNPIPAIARQVLREKDPTKFSEILLSMLASTRPQQFGQLVRDALVEGPERADALRPGGPRPHRKAG